MDRIAIRQSRRNEIDQEDIGAVPTTTREGRPAGRRAPNNPEATVCLEQQAQRFAVDDVRTDDEDPRGTPLMLAIS
jgi:hypothetical protein